SEVDSPSPGGEQDTSVFESDTAHHRLSVTRPPREQNRMVSVTYHVQPCHRQRVLLLVQFLHNSHPIPVLPRENHHPIALDDVPILDPILRSWRLHVSKIRRIPCYTVLLIDAARGC